MARASACGQVLAYRGVWDIQISPALQQGVGKGGERWAESTVWYGGGCRAALSQHQALESRMCTQGLKAPGPRANSFW